MKYKCNCTPTQEYPHSVNSGQIKLRALKWTNIFKSTEYNKVNFIFAHLIEHQTPAKSCDGHPIPVKKYDLYILGKYIMSFGKIVY